MTEEKEDAELKAMGVLIDALSQLDLPARERVLAYVFTRLGMKPAAAAPETRSIQRDPEPPHHEPGRPGSMKNIRSFTEEKNPRSANEMAAVVAYFLQYEAPDDERKDAISKAEIDKYFHLAKFTKPSDATFTLTNSKNAGYLDSKGGGKYALNPVGYNLVAHKLGAESNSTAPGRRSTRKKSSTRRKRK